MVESTSAARPLSLRDHILASLSGLSNPYPLALYVLSSSPKKTLGLFPFAVNPPRCYEKEYLVVVSAEVPVREALRATAGLPSTASSPPVDPSSDKDKPAAQSVLVAALHVYVYTMPSNDTSIVYISKLDTSGHLAGPLAIARTLATSFITYHILPSTRPSTHVRVRLFARSQGQYLFPNSAQVQGKRVSGGLVLCGWWKRVYEGCARLLREAQRDAETETENEARRDALKLRYLLPSYSAAEARGMLGASKVALPPGVEWTYGPPFVTPIAKAHGSGPSKETSLAWSIPSLPDDPATRFLDELVVESSTAIAKRRDSAAQVQDVTTGEENRAKNRQQKDKERDEAERARAQAFLGTVSDEEFWERMGFRQECISGDVTGFFALDVDSAATSCSASPTQSAMSSRANDTCTPAKTDLPPAIVDRIHKALLNCDFGTFNLAVDGTSIWLKSAKAIATDEIGENGWDACTGCVPAKASLSVGGEKKEQQAVTMLQPRRKKRTDAPAPAINVLQPRKREKQ